MEKQFKSTKTRKQFSLTLLFAIAFSTVVSAQTNTEVVDFYQSIFGMEKKEVVAGFLQLESDNAFWPIYDAYENERKALGKKKIALLNDYADNYLTLTDEKTDELVKQTMTQKKQLDKLINTYYKKVKNVSGSKVAAQFYQFENYILGAIRLEVMESIPFIGEFDI